MAEEAARCLAEARTRAKKAVSDAGSGQPGPGAAKARRVDDTMRETDGGALQQQCDGGGDGGEDEGVGGQETRDHEGDEAREEVSAASVGDGQTRLGMASIVVDGGGEGGGGVEEERDGRSAEEGVGGSEQITSDGDKRHRGRLLSGLHEVFSRALVAEPRMSLLQTVCRKTINH